MEQAGLRISLTAEVDQAIRSLNNVNAQFERMGVEATRALHDAESALRDLGSGTVSINRLSQALNVFRQASLAATDTGSLQQYNRNIQLLETEINNLSRSGRTLNNAIGGNNGAGFALQNLGRVASDAPFGFIAIQNNIDPLIQSLGQLSTQSGGTGKAIKALLSSLAGPAGIALAFTLVTAGATTLISKYGSLSAGLAALNPFLDDAAKAQLVLNKAQLDGTKSAQTELAHLDSLYRATQNLNVPLQDRKAIVGELQKQYPEVFSNYTREAILAGKASGAIDGLKQSLIALSVARATEKLAATQGESLASLQIQADALKKSLVDLQKNGNKPSLSSPFGADPIALARDIAAKQNEINKNKADQAVIEGKILDIQKVQDSLAERFGAKALGVKGAATTASVLTQLTVALAEVDAKAKLTGETAKEIAKDKLPLLNKAFDAIATAGDGDAKSALANLGAQIKSLDAVAATKNLPSVADILAKLGRDLNAVNAQSQLLGGTLGSIATEKVKLLQNAFEDLVRSGLTPASPQLQKLVAQINDLGNNLNLKPLKSAIPTAITDSVKALRTGDKLLTGEEFKKLLGITSDSQLDIPVNIKPVAISSSSINQDLVTSFEQASINFQNKINQKQAEISARINQFTKDINDLIQESTRDGISSLADSVGAALVSGNINSVLGSFVDTISSFLTSMGKLLIIQGGAIEAFKASLSSFQGIGAIAAGAALIAASAAFKSLAGKGVHSYATGGIVTSPQLALIGDNPGRKEAVVPSEMFDKIGGGVGDMVLTTKIKGNDLYVLVQRAGREFNRFN
jgi:hypothetical protein